MESDNLITEGKTALEEVAPDILSLRTLFVNILFVGLPGARQWVLIDTGLAGFASDIIHIAEERFMGPPTAIILTHGHFDHVGNVIELVQHWGAPVYAHPMELPFLTGVSDYPPADPSASGGLLAKLSFAYPNEAIHLDDRVAELPTDHSIPGAPDWRWIHTPGHSPGHVSLFRDLDHALIAGDAVITVQQESLWHVLFQDKELNGPPTYFTTDWDQAKRSVESLTRLQPDLLVTGHGHVMKGAQMSDQLERLARNFEIQAVPKHGRYV
ncbi:MBL fold metallo-hydrolase [Paenibacillus provencensis]|uniref:MBL fold metallo-hydrolase n=1 Tax=Paenibacillus provencensis TaxID=441151 RepID=A0ABW3PKN2_9BACL|nr:MBL fold metallo-hydrolase [Paenibacillus sp. MER 78]MCM3126767.1 MBL fold metallo-hydrolase [Paenibacillus sp. MER 78]